MNPHPSDSPHRPDSSAQARLDRFLDGLMDATEREAFERELASSEELRRLADADARLLGMLHAAYAPPAEGATVIGRAGEVGSLPLRRPSRLRPALGIAALLAIGMLAVALLVGRPRAPLAELYLAQQGAGFVPAVVCTSDSQFRQWTRDRIGVELTPPSAEPGVTLAGWSYAESPARYTFLLLASVDGRDVVVAMGTGADPIAPPSRSAGLNAFPRRVGNVWMYEITPLDKPRIVPGIAVVGG